MTRVLIAAVAAASLTACSGMGMGMGGGRMNAGMSHTMPDGAPMQAPMPGMVMPTQAMAYMRAAGESDLFEITSSQVALQRTQNPAVRAYATTMIDHHTRTTNTLLSTARAALLMPPPAVLGPDKRAMIDQLNSQAGMNFDRLYIQQQVTGHQEALAIHGGYAQGGDNAALRATAAATVPVVQGHLSTAQSIQGRMGGMGGM